MVRTSFQDSRITCWRNVITSHTTERSIHFWMKNKTRSHLLVIVFTNTRCFVSTTQHTTCSALRTQSIYAPNHMSWHWDMKMKKLKQHGICIGMPESLRFSMSTSGSQIVWRPSAWSSSGSIGSDAIWITKAALKLVAFTVLGSLIVTTPHLMDFSTPVTPSEGYI